MYLPHWVENENKALPTAWTGQIVIELWSGGVTRVDWKTIMTAPKADRIERHAITA